MTTAMVARASRQSVILAAVAGLHVGAFVLISTGLGMQLKKLVLPESTITVQLPEPNPSVPVAPDEVREFEYRIAAEPKPDLEIPLFNERSTLTPATWPAAGSAAVATDDVSTSEYRAPALRTRDNRLASLIDACYPTASRRMGEEGRVVARVTLDVAGRPSAWSVEQTSGYPRLDSGVGCVIRRLEFIPGRRDGHGIEAIVLLPIAFRLH